MFWELFSKKESLEKTIEHITPEHVVIKAFSQIQKETQSKFIKYKLIEEKVEELWEKAKNYANGHSELEAQEATTRYLEKIPDIKRKHLGINMVFGTAPIKCNPIKGVYCVANEKIYEKIIKEYDALILESQ